MDLQTKDYFSEKGFTLLEMLMSTLVMGLLVGGAIAAYTRMATRNAVANTGGDFVVVMRDVQKRAQSGEKPQQCVDAGGKLLGWSIAIKSETSYIIGAECEGFTDPVSEEEFYLSEGIVFDQWSLVGKIVFEVLSGSASTNKTVIIKDTGGDYNYQISISTSGGVGGGLN